MALELIVTNILKWINENGVLASLGSILLTFVGTFGTGLMSEFFEKRRERRSKIESFMGKVTDVIAIVTSAGYKLRQNEQDRRRILRAAFQLERLGKKEMATSVRSYLNMWNLFYNLHSNAAKGSNSKEYESEALKLICGLDELTDKILNSKRSGS